MENLVNKVNEICGTNGCTTVVEVSKALNVSYNKTKYWIDKYYKQGLLGIIYPGLGGVRLNHVYNKCCSIKSNQ